MRRFAFLPLAGLLACLPLAIAATESTALRPDGASGAATDDADAAPRAERIATGLDAAVNVAFGPDGALHYGEWKTGKVVRIGADGARETVLDVGEPAWGNERGFVGLAIDAEGSFYTFTTYDGTDGAWFNRVSRWDGGKETPLLDRLPAGDWHNAGRIHVDPRDGTVWVAYGDVNGKAVAQDPDDLRGKILHLTRDGRPAAGNLAPDSFAYSLGHRQPFGFAVDFATGRVMVAENMDAANDEVNVVEPGGNYGWPVCEGPCSPADSRFEDPVLYYPQTIGPTSGAFLAGDFYFGDFNRGQLHRVREREGAWEDTIVYTHASPPILDLKPGPEGNTLYFSTWSELWRLTFPKVDAKSPDGSSPWPATGSDPPAESPATPPATLPTPGLGPAAAGIAFASALLLRRARR